MQFTRAQVGIAVAIAALLALTGWLIATLPSRDTPSPRTAPPPSSAGSQPPAPTPSPGAPAVQDRIRLAGAMQGSSVVNSGSAQEPGHVTSLNGGAVRSVTEGGDTFLRFPATVCRTAPCPQVVVELPTALEPGNGPFSFGADVRLTKPADPGTGMNVFQQGLAAKGTGQWKLQLDYGHPSCRFSDGQSVVLVPQKLHDPAFKLEVGAWYSVRCARTASDTFSITVTRRGSSTPAATATHTAPLGAITPKGTPTIGGKNIGADRTDLQTDQYHDDLANIWWSPR